MPGEQPKPGAVEGRVVEAGSDEPVKKALVILSRGEKDQVGTYTDSSGKFQFTPVEPGAYTVTAERDGFVTPPRTEPVVATVKPETTESGITLKLVRTGAVSGRVLDSDGESLSGASVQLKPVGPAKPGPGGALWAGSNDRGEYRIFHVAPGRYRIAGTVSDDPRHLELRVQRPRGPAGPTPEQAYAISYYPGTADVRQATVVDVGAGADLSGYDILMQRVHAVRVRGHVVCPPGKSRSIIFLSLESLPPGTGQSRTAVVRDSGGAFEFLNVLPGRYVVKAQAALERNESGHRAVEVNETDLEGVQVVLAPPQKLAGSIAVPPGRKLTPDTMVMLMPHGPLGSSSGGMAPVAADGTFSMSDVAPGDYDVILGSTGPGDDLYVSSIRHAEDDALADGVHVGGSPPGPLQITLKANGGSMECAVTNADGNPLPNAQVMLLPDPPRRSEMALYGQCRTEPAGSCTLLGMAPGEYHAFAFTKQTDIDLRDPEAFKPFEKYGQAVKTGEGQKQRLELQAIPEE